MKVVVDADFFSQLYIYFRYIARNLPNATFEEEDIRTTTSCVWECIHQFRTRRRRRVNQVSLSFLHSAAFKASICSLVFEQGALWQGRMKAGAGFYCSIASLLCCHACGLCSASSTIRPSNAVIEYYVEVKWKPCMSFGKVLIYNLGTFISFKSRLFNVGFIVKKVRAPNIPYLIQDLTFF